MALYGITDSIARGVEGVQTSVSGALFEPTIRLGVTGLARAGKTVFITSLIANLLARGRMAQFAAHRDGRIEAVHLQPQPDLTLPRFEFETHLATMTGEEPTWPESTRSLSELRLSFRVRPSGWLSSWRGPRTLHLDIVDYPGEWLLDLGLMEKSYAEWSDETLTRMDKRPEAADFLALARAEDGALRFDEARGQAVARVFTEYLVAARSKGHSDCTPGRFLLPGDLAGSPVLTFAPLPRPADTPRGCLWREMERRYGAYKDQVVVPFFRDHFAKIDRQVVLMDVLGAIHRGPWAVEEMRNAMADLMAAFRLGRPGWLASLLGAKGVDRLLFAATKADYLHHEQHPALTAIANALLTEARSRAEFAGAEVTAMSVAALRATVEEKVERDGARLPAVRGRLDTGKTAVMYAGELPDNPMRILGPARAGADRWLDADFGLMNLLPARNSLKQGEGPPHIRLDRALEFLIGDRM